MRWVLGAWLCLLLAPEAAIAGEVEVAVAANFTGPMKALAPGFERATGDKVMASFASTGSLYAQIRNGAPFKVFLSADRKTAARLEREGVAVAGSRFTYAVGKLALWSARAGYVDARGRILKQGGFRHLAIANPLLAPYGAAAIEVLRALDLQTTLKARLVEAENIAQTYQFVASGDAELGFVALSQVQKKNRLDSGSAWVVPGRFYAPIRQDAVLLANGRGSAAARALIAYLKSPGARKLIESYGYGL